jgi:hypothetical protein
MKLETLQLRTKRTLPRLPPRSVSLNSFSLCGAPLYDPKSTVVSRGVWYGGMGPATHDLRQVGFRWDCHKDTGIKHVAACFDGIYLDLGQIFIGWCFEPWVGMGYAWIHYFLWAKPHPVTTMLELHEPLDWSKRENAIGGHVFVFVQFSLTNQSIWNTYQLGKPGMGAILYFVCAIINKHYTMCHILNIFKMKSTYLSNATFKHLSNAPRCFTRCAIYTEICVDSCLRMGLFVKNQLPCFLTIFACKTAILGSRIF